MSKIELSLKVPKTLSDITLGQYQEYMAVVKLNEEDANATDFLNKKALELFCGLELKESYNLPLKSFLGILEHLNGIFSVDTPLKRHFTFRDPEGKEQLMGFIPNIEKMTFGEYVDANTYFEDWANMHKLMAVLFRPVKMISGERYQIRDYEGTNTYGEAMKSMPVDIAIGARVFFLSFINEISERYPEIFGESTGTIRQEQRNFAQRWGWYPSLYALAGGDASRIDEATKIPLGKAMMFLSYEAGKNELEMKLLK